MEPGFTDKLPESLAQSRVVIIGLGLMGASLALALRGQCKALVGLDVSEEVCLSAVQMNVVDAAYTEARKALTSADIVIIAVPVKAILELLDLIPEYIQSPVIVMDLGSTKAIIFEKMQQLPANFDPLPGHPMCGKETSGIHNADDQLFKQAPFVLSPLARTSSRALRLGESLIAAVGAKVLILDHQAHDLMVAATSHLPYILSCALALSVPPSAAPLARTGFQSTARLAGSDPRMMGDTLLTNKQAVLEAVNKFIINLQEITGTLNEDNEDELMQILGSARENRRNILGEPK